MEKEKTQTKESGWNLSEAIIILISNLMRDASMMYSRGLLREAFYKWKSIKMLVFNRFTPEERAHLKQLEKDIHPKSNYRKSDTFGESYTYDRDKFAELLEDYIEELTLLLRKYKLDITDKEKKDRLY